MLQIDTLTKRFGDKPRERDSVPLGFRVGLAFLGEDRLEHRGHRGALPGRGMGQGVAHPVNPAALMGGVEDPAR